MRQVAVLWSILDDVYEYRYDGVVYRGAANASYRVGTRIPVLVVAEYPADGFYGNPRVALARLDARHDDRTTSVIVGVLCLALTFGVTSAFESLRG